MAQSRGVEEGTGTNHALVRQARDFPGVVAHHVNGVRYHQEDAVKARRHDLLDHRAHHTKAGLEHLEAVV